METLQGQSGQYLATGYGVLQVVLEPNPDRCVNEDVELPWGVGVDCEIPHRLVRRTKHSLYVVWIPHLERGLLGGLGSMPGTKS